MSASCGRQRKLLSLISYQLRALFNDSEHAAASQSSAPYRRAALLVASASSSSSSSRPRTCLCSLSLILSERFVCTFPLNKKPLVRGATFPAQGLPLDLA